MNNLNGIISESMRIANGLEKKDITSGTKEFVSFLGKANEKIAEYKIKNEEISKENKNKNPIITAEELKAVFDRNYGYRDGRDYTGRPEDFGVIGNLNKNNKVENKEIANEEKEI